MALIGYWEKKHTHKAAGYICTTEDSLSTDLSCILKLDKWVIYTMGHSCISNMFVLGGCGIEAPFYTIRDIGVGEKLTKFRSNDIEEKLTLGDDVAEK